MPVTVSYPGLYLEEIPSNAHSIVAAPTSIAVFVGYSHPFKTKYPGKPVRLNSFSDYERFFGGIFVSSAIETDLPHAVYQFFLNGGSDCYVVGLIPKYQMGLNPPQDILPANAPQNTNTGQIVFTAREPTDTAATQIAITITNIRTGTIANDTADFVISYGKRIETYRGVVVGEAGFKKINEASSLVTLTPNPTYGTAFADATVKNLTLSSSPPTGFVQTFNAGDYTPVFDTDEPLDKLEIFNLLVLPGVSDNGVLSAALAFAERKQAFAIIDPPFNAIADSGTAADVVTMFGDIPRSQNGAFYFPYLQSTNPIDGSPIQLAPSGFVAGIYARTDTQRGVWKAPAGLEALVKNTTGVVESGRMNDPRQGVLNLEGINCLRQFTGIGTVVFGARTLVSKNPAFQDYMYVPVRRMALFIEQSLLQNLKWAVFEPNDEPLWQAIRLSVGNFMLSLFNQGALQGSKPSEAFLVQCDRSTTTPDEQRLGRVNIVVAFAPLKPAEFVVIKLAQLAGQTQS